MKEPGNRAFRFRLSLAKRVDRSGSPQTGTFFTTFLTEITGSTTMRPAKINHKWTGVPLRARWLRRFVFALFIGAASYVATSGSPNLFDDVTILGPHGSDFKSVESFEDAAQHYPQAQWLKATNPESFGWNNEKLSEIEKYLRSLSTDAFLVVENAVVIYSYGEVAQRFRCRSMRKSFMSALYGIHVAEGNIEISQSLDELNVDDIALLSKQEKRATIRDLLSARSGIYHAAAFETSTMRKKRPPRGSHAPGTFWFYNNWDFNALLTIFEQETRANVFQEFKERIADPLSMQQFRLTDTRYYYETSKSRHPAYLFKMSALDLARFGLLFEKDGIWEGKQLIPLSWIEESTRPHTIFKNARSPRRGYGYMWYSADEGYYAAGKGGQRLMVLPEWDIVVVHLVDTGVKGRKVKSRDFWKLIEKVKKAKDVQGKVNSVRIN